MEGLAIEAGNGPSGLFLGNMLLPCAITGRVCAPIGRSERRSHLCSPSQMSWIEGPPEHIYAAIRCHMKEGLTMDARRMSLRVFTALGCFAFFVPRPARACYCVEYCQSVQATVTAPTEGEGQTPSPNSYVVEITWTPYSNAPSDCQYTVEGAVQGGEGTLAPLSSCTFQYDASSEADGASCTVTGASPATGTSGQQVGVTWTFQVSGDSAGTPSADSFCNTSIFLPGTLSAPTATSAARGTNGEVTINWSAPEGRVQAANGTLSQIQGFEVYRSSGSDPSPKLVAQAKATDTTLVDQVVASESYRYDIYAADQYGVGQAATVDVPGGEAVTGGCTSAGSLGAPLGLGLVVGTALLRRRRPRG